MYPQNQPQLLTRMRRIQQLTMNLKNRILCNKHLKSIKNWNFLQPGNEIEWLTITQDFLKGFPSVHSKQKLQLIITLMKFHVEAKKMALIKLHRAIEEEDCDPLIEFFQWITINYKMSKRQKMILLQKTMQNKKLDWKSNPADEIESANSRSSINSWWNHWKQIPIKPDERNFKKQNA